MDSAFGYVNVEQVVRLAVDQKSPAEGVQVLIPRDEVETVCPRDEPVIAVDIKAVVFGANHVPLAALCLGHLFQATDARGVRQLCNRHFGERRAFGVELYLLRTVNPFWLLA